ncbi:MAG: protein kinase domain-containing protein, partial [Deltaproteobacteria bacterium]
MALGVELSESLSALHAAKTVHRDLKPGNVRLLRGPGRRSKLLDFGTVRSLEATALHEERTSAGVLVGTPGYVSPEQARGEPIDARSDLFSLGAVLYACVAGTAPFRGASPVATLAKVVLEDPPLLRARRPECPSGLERLVARLLEKEPSRRPASAEEVARALEALAGEPAPEPDTSSGVLRAREQRFACVLMARPAVPPESDEMATLSGGRTLRQSAPPSVSESLVEGARHEMLRDGTKVFVWSGEGTASDIARRAAGAALELAPFSGDGAKVLASGRASVDEALPVGEAVDRAATLLAAARGRGSSVMGPSASSPVFVDENVARLVEDRFEVRSEGGRRWLVGERTGPAGVRTLLGRAMPCVGRESELSVLDLTLLGVGDEGTAAAVVLTGEMGVGKSRVRQEWVRALAANHPEVLVCQAHADVMHERAAYGVASRLVRDGCGVPFGAGAEQVRRAILEAVTRVVEDKDRLRIASRLSELCGAPWDEDVDEALVTAREDAIVMGDQLRAAWEDFLVASCR